MFSAGQRAKKSASQDLRRKKSLHLRGFPKLMGPLLGSLNSNEQIDT